MSRHSYDPLVITVDMERTYSRPVFLTSSLSTEEFQVTNSWLRICSLVIVSLRVDFQEAIVPFAVESSPVDSLPGSRLQLSVQA